jgi:hypothetical protein
MTHTCSAGLLSFPFFFFHTIIAIMMMTAMPASYTLEDARLNSWLDSPTTLKTITGIKARAGITMIPFVCGTEGGRILPVGTVTTVDTVTVTICADADKKTVWVGPGESPSFSFGDSIDCVTVMNVVLVGDFLCVEMVAEVWRIFVVRVGSWETTDRLKENFGAREVGCDVLAIVGRSGDFDRGVGSSLSPSCLSSNLETWMGKGRRLRLDPIFILSETDGKKKKCRFLLRLGLRVGLER